MTRLMESARKSATRNFAGAAILAGSSLAAFVFVSSAHASFTVCNETPSRIGVSIGYKDLRGWASEGWWNLAPAQCKRLIEGDLIARYYYVHAMDYERGGWWVGRASMCVHDRKFTARGATRCESRGYRKAKFLEIDTGEEPDWTVALSDPPPTPSTSSTPSTPSEGAASDRSRSP